ncbi:MULTISPECIES: DUF5959 family protein [unclassified Streptomyces]|uniref:DUF5959 family protein n=1 Tax=unclassified Streptomyces TaxID=2593676 RepID=UPI0004BDDE59|nr:MULTISPECIES: DUF5959 family protein [unclassified Streptomyces]
MSRPIAVDLIDLRDTDGNRCVVRVVGRYQPGVLTGHDTLRAEVLVSADFLDARLELFLFQDDLDAWQRDLTRLAQGGDAGLGGDRGLSLGFHMHDDRSVWLTVNDPDRLSAMLAIRPHETWIEEHHERLGRVREAFPGEVVETAPMTYAWSPTRAH